MNLTPEPLEAQCNICLDLAIEAVFCPVCNHGFCTYCAQKWRKVNNQCPLRCHDKPWKIHIEAQQIHECEQDNSVTHTNMSDLSVISDLSQNQISDSSSSSASLPENNPSAIIIRNFLFYGHQSEYRQNDSQIEPITQESEYTSSSSEIQSMIEFEGCIRYIRFSQAIMPSFKGYIRQEQDEKVQFQNLDDYIDVEGCIKMPQSIQIRGNHKHKNYFKQ